MFIMLTLNLIYGGGEGGQVYSININNPSSSYSFSNYYLNFNSIIIIISRYFIFKNYSY